MKKSALALLSVLCFTTVAMAARLYFGVVEALYTANKEA